MKANAVISRQLVVAVEIGRTVVCGQQNVQVPIAIKVGVRQTAADLGLSKSAVHVARDILEFPSAQIQEELRRLGVAHVAVNVANSFLDVSVSDRQIEEAVEVYIEKCAAEAQCIP